VTVSNFHHDKKGASSAFFIITTLLSRNISYRSITNRFFQCSIAVNCRELREFSNNIFRCIKQETLIRFAKHRGIVIRIPCCNHAEVQAMQCFNCLALLVWLAQFICSDHAFFISFKLMTENGWPAQLFHERMSKLVEGVRKDNQLEMGTHPFYKLLCPFKWSHIGNDFLNITQTQTMFF